MVWPVANPAAEPALKPGLGPDAAATLVTRVAHDFNSLLAPVLGNVILLQEEAARGEHLVQRLRGIREATEAARSFAQRLTTVDPRRKFALEPANLGQVVRDCLPVLRAALGGEIAIEDHLDAPVDSVRVNRKQLEQALLQLALNAQDAMPAGGKLSLTLDMVEKAVGGGPARPWARLRVQDNGRGMEPSLLEHAFDLFVSTKVPGCGVGLGLASVSSIVRHHGGGIEAESQPGKGATFSIYLPSDGLPGSGRERAPDVRAADATPAPTVPEATLLLVEDNAMVRRSVDNTLRGMGYRVLAVESGERCLEIVRDPAQRVDLLITDVVMPEMSGKELIERVHVMRPGLSVLFMSGYDRSTLASRKQPVVIEHFLQKPFDSEDLSQAVRKAIEAGVDPLDPGKR
jgi:CheY-like chemotaxis protein